MAGRRRIETAALVLPIFGALLIVPPLIGVFNLPVALFGIPLIAIYLFAVWIGLIGATAMLSRRLGRTGGGGEDEPR
jgi:hypothetical protein